MKNLPEKIIGTLIGVAIFIALAGIIFAVVNEVSKQKIYPHKVGDTICIKSFNITGVVNEVYDSSCNVIVKNTTNGNLTTLNINKKLLLLESSNQVKVEK